MTHVHKRKEKAIFYQGQENIGEIIKEWTIPEFIKLKRGKLWYIVALIIGIILLVYAAITLNFLFAIIIVLGSVILFFENKQHPRTFAFKITDRGILVGPKFHLFKDIEKFWIIYEPPEIQNLYFAFKGIAKTPIAVPLDNINPLEIRDILLDFLPEDLDQENELPTDSIRRILKF